MALTAERKRPTPRKKRAGQHHRKNQRYLKHYWPYLPMLLVVAGGLLLNSFWPHTISVLGAHNDLSPSRLLVDTNNERSSAGKPALKLNTRLSSAAQTKANDMVARNYWSHNTPTDEAPWTFVSTAGYNYASVGENLAYGFTSADQVMTGWLQSPEHRANVLNQGYTEVGFATATSDNYVGQGPETVVVAMYGAPGDVTAAPSVTQSSTPSNVTGNQLAARPVSRLAAISPDESLLPMLVASLTSVALVVFVSRHIRFLHRSLVRGEAFVLAHPLFDIALVAVVMLGFVLSRTAAFVL
jgi:hypothetical protein